ncbi:MAG TPA: hypothetical protein VER08_01450 [Pyrinomonadaceae bacterium]|nr:hypothetical protein [Pyrinomonadaceae bacterium]
MRDLTQAEKRFGAKAVAVGAGVFVAGLLLVFVAGVLFGSAAAYRASQAGADEQQIAEQVARRLAGPTFGFTALAIASVFTLLGGWAAARLAGSAALRHALPVGLLALFASILLLLLAPFAVPVWLLAAVIVAPVPLALAGGYLGGRGWHPPAAEEEDDAEEAAAETEGEAGGLTRWTPRRARAEEQHTRLVGRLVEQRREQESEWQRERDEAARRRELELAIEQSKSEACDDMRAVVREAFLSHPAATEEDFERCWPELRDEVFREHALRAYAGRAAQQAVNSES